MKEAEENKIQELQRLANLAKTDDEKRAIEAKIALAKKESDEKIRLAEEEMAAKTSAIEELTNFTSDTTTSVLNEATKASEKQIKISEEEAVTKMEFKEELEETIAEENRKARVTEMAEKKKAFAAQKKADIATALITGALAVLKALANFFPLNIILAAAAAVVTGVQIAKIKNQPEPSFADGGTLGFVPQGGKHGSVYGVGGIGLFDRATGRDVGEMEGGEAIISTRQTEANWPIIQKMFKNARTPGMADTPVIQHASVPMAFRDGGKFESPYFERGMYLFGSKKRKAQDAANKAEMEAARAQEDADAAAKSAGNVSADTSSFDGVDANDPAATGDTAGAVAAQEKSQRLGEDQYKAILAILDETKANGEKLQQVAGSTGDLKNSIIGVEGAVNSVRDAVYNTNTQGKFDQLIGAISSMSA
jgi:chemotaxis protein histidine kinase CheA